MAVYLVKALINVSRAELAREAHSEGLRAAPGPCITTRLTMATGSVSIMTLRARRVRVGRVSEEGTTNSVAQLNTERRSGDAPAVSDLVCGEKDGIQAVQHRSLLHMAAAANRQRRIASAATATAQGRATAAHAPQNGARSVVKAVQDVGKHNLVLAAAPQASGFRAAGLSREGSTHLLLRPDHQQGDVQSFPEHGEEAVHEDDFGCGARPTRQRHAAGLAPAPRRAGAGIGREKDALSVRADIPLAFLCNLFSREACSGGRARREVGVVHRATQPSRGRAAAPAGGPDPPASHGWRARSGSTWRRRAGRRSPG